MTQLTTQPAANPMQLLQVALESNVDPERLGQIMDLQERWLEGQARKSYFGAMRAVQESLPTVVRDAENSHTKSKYTRLETLSRAIDPVIHRNGFSITFGSAETTAADCIRVTADVMHEDGHATHHFVDLPLDSAGSKGNSNKTGVQATGSTLSYGRRYLKCLIFDVTIAGEDDDGNRVPVISENQARLLQDLIDTHEVDMVRFWKWAGIERIADLPFDKFASAKEMLLSKPRKEQDDATL